MAWTDILAALGVGSVVGTIIGTVVSDWWEKRTRRTELRKTLHEEIEQMRAVEDMEQHIEETSGPLDLSHEMGFNALYEANADKVGDLSDEEVEMIVEFYSLLKQMERLNDIVDADEDITNTKLSDLVTELRVKREELLEELESHM